jgi:hypothetical protein
MPIKSRIFSKGTAMPCSASASTHARACASLLSTSVPSMSSSTPSKGRAMARDPIPRRAHAARP